MTGAGVEVAGVGHPPPRFPPFPKTRERMRCPQWGEAKKEQIPRLRLVMTNRRRDDKQRKRDGDGREAKKEQIPHFVRDDKRKRRADPPRLRSGAAGVTNLMSGADARGDKRGKGTRDCSAKRKPITRLRLVMTTTQTKDLVRHECTVVIPISTCPSRSAGRDDKQCRGGHAGSGRDDCATGGYVDPEPVVGRRSALLKLTHHRFVLPTC